MTQPCKTEVTLASWPSPKLQGTSSFRFFLVAKLRSRLQLPLLNVVVRKTRDDFFFQCDASAENILTQNRIWSATPEKRNEASQLTEEIGGVRSPSICAGHRVQRPWPRHQRGGERSRTRDRQHARPPPSPSRSCQSGCGLSCPARDTPRNPVLLCTARLSRAQPQRTDNDPQRAIPHF